MMTPERRVYAVKRLARLTAKLSCLDEEMAAGVSQDAWETIRKARRSTITAIKRWQKEITNETVA
jgi:hypothetical protein